MIDFNIAFSGALNMLWNLDSSFIEIILLSLQVSLMAVIIACLISMPFAAFLSIKKFPGRGLLIVFINALMGLPPVVVGLFLYLLLSAQGPLAAYNLLYSPPAMVIAQVIIITPIVAALSKQSIDSFFEEYKDYLKSIRATNIDIIKTLLWEARYSLMVNGLAGLGRALSEVGAVIIVGGNIAHVTRVMTTSIVLETSRGELSFALGLGIALITISILINGALYMIRNIEESPYV